MSIQQALSQAKTLLAASVEQPDLEAEILLGAVLEKPRSYLHAWSESSLSASQQSIFTTFIQRRLNKEPIAYITGSREFWSLPLLVTSDTLIPRPETELLVETALSLCQAKTDNVSVADLGTGSGAIALALANEKPAWEVVATDASEAALKIAKNNAQRLGITNINFLQGNWCAALSSLFDLIVSNPPYIAECEWEAYETGLAYEPRAALVSGIDGLDAIRQISRSAKQYLKPGGYVLVEHGFLQGGAVRGIFEEDGYNEVRTLLDLSGHERITLGRI